MAPPKLPRQTPRTEDEASETAEDGTGSLEAQSASASTIDALVEEMVESNVADLREEIETLERQIEAVDDFARISLNERKVKQNETSLSEFSDSLTAFAETAFHNLNVLEDRLDTQALLLAAVVESLDDVDLEEVRRYQHGNRVLSSTPEERLAGAIDAAADTESIESIEGIGPTYAERLAEAGIDSATALADADPKEVASIAEVSTEQATEWTDRAR